MSGAKRIQVTKQTGFELRYLNLVSIALPTTASPLWLPIDDCGFSTVGRMVATFTRVPQFESRRNHFLNIKTTLEKNVLDMAKYKKRLFRPVSFSFFFFGWLESVHGKFWNRGLGREVGFKMAEMSLWGTRLNLVRPKSNRCDPILPTEKTLFLIEPSQGCPC